MITLLELLTDEKYKKMSVDELTHIIKYQLSYNDFQELHGGDSIEKAEQLKWKWDRDEDKTVMNKRTNLYYGEHLSLNQIEKILIDMQDEESEAPISFESRLNIMTTLRSIVKGKLKQKDLH